MISYSCYCMSKWKLWGYPKIYLRHSVDLKISIKNIDCIDIAGNVGRKTFQRIPFGIFLMESLLWNPNLDDLTIQNSTTINSRNYLLDKKTWSNHHLERNDQIGKCSLFLCGWDLYVHSFGCFVLSST